MSMLDDLQGTVKRRPGPLCAVQRLKQAPVECPNPDCDSDAHGFDDAMEILTTEGFSWSQRQQALMLHGFDWDKQLIGRHTRTMLESRSGCKRCVEWLS